MTTPEARGWAKFFKEAGIPPAICSKYATIFCDHRIQREILGDLTRDILHDIGIEAMGDKLAILKQAKVASEQYARETTKKLLNNERNSPKPSSPAQRMINHNTNARDFSKASPNPKEEKQKKQQSEVFERLGNGAEPATEVFNRLGKSEPTSKPLHYAGVLKAKKSPAISTSKVLKPKPVEISVLDRLGPAVVEKQEVPKVKPTIAKQVIKLNSTSVMGRLGAKRVSADSTASIGEKKFPNITKTVITTPPTVPAKPKKLILKKKITVKKISTENPARTRKKLLLKKPASTTANTKTMILKRKSLEMDKQQTFSTEVSPNKIIRLTRLVSPPSNAKQRLGNLVEVHKKPISSNKVSSTSSAGLFHGSATVEGSVFSRLGKS